MSSGWYSRRIRTPAAVRACLLDVQHDLFDLGGELCLPGRTAITPEYVARLERTLDRFNVDLPPLEEFILPGGGRAHRPAILLAPCAGVPVCRCAGAPNVA